MPIVWIRVLPDVDAHALSQAARLPLPWIGRLSLRERTHLCESAGAPRRLGRRRLATPHRVALGSSAHSRRARSATRGSAQGGSRCGPTFPGGAPACARRAGHPPSCRCVPGRDRDARAAPRAHAQASKSGGHSACPARGSRGAAGRPRNVPRSSRRGSRTSSSVSESPPSALRWRPARAPCACSSRRSSSVPSAS